MAAGAAWGACDFGPGLSDLLNCVRDVLGHVGAPSAQAHAKAERT